MKTRVSVGATFLLIPFATLASLAGCGVCDFKKSDRARLDLGFIGNALKLHYGKLGRYPSTEEGLEALESRHLIDAVPRDPWGNPYRYAFRNGEIELHSWGADGQRGGSGEDADLDLRDVMSRLGARR